MSERYKIRDQDRIYFLTFSVIGWIDVFTRNEYKNIVVESLRFCQSKKGLLIYAWCIMSNHLHMIVGRNGSFRIEEIIRDFKKYTSVQLCRAIENNDGESRKEWMLSYFRKAAESSSKHVKYQFWQNEYHPIELSSNKMQDQRLHYLHNNPVEAGIVDKPEYYIYSSARNYSMEKGLLDIRSIQ